MRQQYHHCVRRRLATFGQEREWIREDAHYGIADPICTQKHVVSKLSNPLPHIGRVRALRIRKCEDALTEHNHVNINGFHILLAVLVSLVERTKADKIVLIE